MFHSLSVCEKYMTKMFPYSHLVQLFIVLVSSSSCFSTTLEGQVLVNHDQPHSLNPIPRNSDGNSKANFVSLMKYDTETFDLPRLYYQVGAPSRSPKMVNVDDFGAKGDGTDDSEAFKEAWKEVCASEDGVFVVPENRIYHLRPIKFSGPCNSSLAMKIEGTIKAPIGPSDYKSDPRHWLLFENIQNFKVDGGGTINGNGKIWWQNSCKINKSRPCKDAPTAATFYGCKNLRVSGLRIRNSQQIHISFQKCVNVKAWNLIIVAPEKSPNTDGIHVTDTQNIMIKSSVIKTGDDCISIVSGSKNVEVTDITCGPGHGISIGSLGKGNSEALVSDVSVNRARFSGTTNGVRIKTWQGGSGYAKNIKFQNVIMHNVSNPIIIDQNYCDEPNKSCPEQDTAVQVENVWYKNIKGTSASEVAIQLNCSKSRPCRGIVLQDVILNLTGAQSDGDAKASCANVIRLSSRGRVSPPCSSSQD